MSNSHRSLIDNELVDSLMRKNSYLTDVITHLQQVPRIFFIKLKDFCRKYKYLNLG